jgi:nucleoside-diphosphate-sugar epimerase
MTPDTDLSDLSTDDASPRTIAELEDRLSAPSPEVIDSLRAIEGDIVVLGAGGKMGFSVARMARRALDALGRGDAVIAVSRFRSPASRQHFAEAGIPAVPCDLTTTRGIAALPDAPNVIYLAGQKFGTDDAPAHTWMANVVAPALVAERYAGQRVVALSTGNVYPLVPASGPGAAESTPPAPVGEYAWSCLGRERIFENAASAGTRLALVRLNYAHDLRYGVLTDIAQRIFHGLPVPLQTNWVNVIWQGDANAAVLRCLGLASSPPFVINLTGPEKVEVRAVARTLAALLGREPLFEGTPASDALLSDVSRSTSLFGAPSVSLDRLVRWTAWWVREGRPLLAKPTHFEARDGRF